MGGRDLDNSASNAEGTELRLPKPYRSKNPIAPRATRTSLLALKVARLAGSGSLDAQRQEDRTNRHVRAPMLAGLAIVLIAAIAVTTIVALDRASEDGAPTVASTPTDPLAGLDGVLARAVLTTNLRATPGRQSEILAIVPTQQLTRVTGRSTDGEWLRLAYPPDSELAGWAPRASFEVERGELATVAVASIGVPEAGQGGVVPSPEDDPLPDLAVINASLLPNGNLTLVVENVGTGRFIGTIGLQVTSGSGELLGVLDTRETSLLPNRTATIDTGLQITTTGSYRIELDRLDRIEEASEFNNVTSVFLVAPGA